MNNVVLQEALLQVLLVLITTLLPTLIAYSVVLVRSKTDEIKAKVGSERFDMIRNFAVIAIQSAEQMGMAEIILNNAEAKKTQAVESVKAMLTSFGLEHLSNSDKLIEDAIEAAIREGWHKGNTPVVETEIIG